MVRTTNIKHAAWDDGAVAGVFMDVLGYDIGQKTTKTRCGKRVNMRHVDNSTPTCADCLADIKRQADGLVMIERYSKDVQAHGVEYANAQAEQYAKERGI